MNYKKVINNYIDEQIALSEKHGHSSLCGSREEFEKEMKKSDFVFNYIVNTLLKNSMVYDLNLGKGIFSGILALGAIGGALANFLTGFNNPIIGGGCVGIALASLSAGVPEIIKSLKFRRQCKLVDKSWFKLCECPNFIDDFCLVNNIRLVEDPFYEEDNYFEASGCTLTFPTPELAGRMRFSHLSQQTQEV